MATRIFIKYGIHKKQYISPDKTIFGTVFNNSLKEVLQRDKSY